MGVRRTFVALDLSLTSTGCAWLGGVETIHVPLPEGASNTQRAVRLFNLTAEIDERCLDADLVVIEGASYGSKATHAHSTGELHGCVKACLIGREVPFALVPPHNLKMFALGHAGKGATKQAVFAEAIRHGLRTDSFDEADAWWLLQMAYVKYGHGAALPNVPEKHLRALSGVQWPELKPV